MKTLIILHGWKSSKEKWDKVKSYIEKEGIDVKVPDLPGFKKETELSSSWDLDNYVDWFENFSGGTEDFFLLGHSFGGRIAIKFAATPPEKLRGLILVGSAGIKHKKTFFQALFSEAAHIGNRLSFLPFFGFFRKVFYRFIVRRSDYLNANGALKETFKKIIDEDLTLLLPRIKTPTLIAWGENDESTPMSDAYLMRDGIKNSKLEVIKDAGHTPYIESPGELADIILNFIKNIR